MERFCGSRKERSLRQPSSHSSADPEVRALLPKARSQTRGVLTDGGEAEGNEQGISGLDRRKMLEAELLILALAAGRTWRRDGRDLGRKPGGRSPEPGPPPSCEERPVWDSMERWRWLGTVEGSEKAQWVAGTGCRRERNEQRRHSEQLRIGGRAPPHGGAKKREQSSSANG